MSYIDRVTHICADRPDIIRAFELVDRKRFLPRSYRKYALFDMPLPIGYGQTTSQPSLIADMFCQADLQSSHRVLEVGAGTGFSASILSQIVSEVYTVEKIPQLYYQAVGNLKDYKNVKVFLATDNLGLPDYAPFDRILVYAYSDVIPAQLIEQLAHNGVMIIPIGNEGQQYLTKVYKKNDKNYVETLYPVRFVPLR